MWSEVEDLSDDELEARLRQSGMTHDALVHSTIAHARAECRSCQDQIGRALS